MVRNFVGTATALAKGTRKADDVADILASMDRRRAGPTAPPHGLVFESVVYPDELAPVGPVFDACGREIGS
jgi:tRNA pseudouridine38-40 synthase